RWSLDAGRPEQGLQIMGLLLWFWSRQNLYLEGWDWGERLLSHPAVSTASEGYALAAVATGALAWFLGNLDGAELWLERARPLLESQGDNIGLGEMHFYRGLCRMTRGDPILADSDLEQSVRLYEEARAHYIATLAMFVHGDVATRFDLQKARNLYQQSLARS